MIEMREPEGMAVIIPGEEKQQGRRLAGARTSDVRQAWTGRMSVWQGPRGGGRYLHGTTDIPRQPAFRWRGKEYALVPSILGC